MNLSPEQQAAVDRVIARFGKSDTLVSTTPPSRDGDMMIAVDVARYVEGTRIYGPEAPSWRWRLTDAGLAARAAKPAATTSKCCDAVIDADSGRR